MDWKTPIGIPDVGLLPRRVMQELTRTTGADAVTVYLSNPAAPYDRSSYVLLGQVGVSADYAPYMWGPLSPASVALFSAVDHLKRRVVADIPSSGGYSGSSFARHQAVRSMARISVRLPLESARRRRAVGRAPAGSTKAAPGVIPPFLEVFLSYRLPRTARTLSAATDRAHSLLTRYAASILGRPELRPIVDPFQVAIRHRRLQRISDRFAESADASLDTPEACDRVLAGIGLAYAALGDLVHRELDLAEGVDGYVSFHAVEFWGRTPSDCEPVSFYVHPPTAAGSLRYVIAANPGKGLCRFAASNGRTVAIENLAKAADVWRRTHLNAGVSGASITVPLYTGRRVFGVMNLEAPTKAGLLESSQRLWQVLPSIEQLLRDLFARRRQVDDAKSRYVQKCFTTYRLNPKREALENRMDVLWRVFPVEACSTTALRDDGAHETAARGEPAAKALLEHPELSRIFVRLAAETAAGRGRHPPSALSVTGARLADGRVEIHSAYGYVRSQRRSERRSDGAIDSFGRLEFTRRDVLPVLDREALAELLASARAGAEALAADTLFEFVVLPIQKLRQERSEDAGPVGLLVLLSADDRFPLTKSSLANLLLLSQALQMVLFTVERLENENNLFSWAAAGVGSIHDLIGAVGKSVEVLRDPSLSGASVRKTVVLLEAIRDHMALLDARTRGGRGGVEDLVTASFHTWIRDIVERSAILSGHRLGSVEVDFKTPDRPVTLSAGRVAPVAAALCNILSNGFKYGGAMERGPRVTARLEGDVVDIGVENRAYEAVFGKALRAAQSVAERVAAGAAAEELKKLLRDDGKNHAMRGIGVWLTARIVSEVLKGEYRLIVDTGRDPDDIIRVEAGVRFKLTAAGEAPEEARSAAAAR
jgi:hypothetical protein